ncbi:RUN domain-containing protein 1 [Culicoides brevitarsis]|uniref:RUN domain-containing protein 1 n=1 Tax=Culicoides brevitarsis TaxID=469753 RepID=UPI00307B5B06
MSFNGNDEMPPAKSHFTFEDFSTEDEFCEKPTMMMPRMDADGADGSSSEPLSTSETALRAMEEEQEMLTSSLMSLTSHFAQVQLRLRQIMESPPEERDQLLKGLEEFAFQGIPELNIPPEVANTENLLDTAVEEQGTRQRELIDTLKSQLEELEKYAYESGTGILPQSILVEKQKVIIDELKSKINLNLDETDLPQLSPDDLKKHVDSALGEFVSPLKMKEQLVTQLKTQITDLERFIKFLQTDGFEKKMMAKGKFNADLKCECKNVHTGEESSKSIKRAYDASSSSYHQPQETLNGKAISLLDKAATMLQFFAMSQFGCSSQRFQMNTLKKTHKGNHWGDLRAQLEVDVQEVLSLVKETSKLLLQERRKKRNNSTSSQDSQDSKLKPPKYSDPELIALSAELTTTVRKRLAISIQRLMEHGLRGMNEQTSLVPFIGCFSHVSRSDYEEYVDGPDGAYREMHAWELILEYYHIKNGEQYNETPARKLSQSFNLDICAGNVQSAKQSLLGTVGTIIALHSPYKRSYNAHFKAFLSAALNAKKLTQWLHLIFQCKELVQTYYSEWSYVRNTGFQDALKSLEILSRYEFELPIDLAVRQFENITDIFI